MIEFFRNLKDSKNFSSTLLLTSLNINLAAVLYLIESSRTETCTFCNRSILRRLLSYEATPWLNNAKFVKKS